MFQELKVNGIVLPRPDDGLSFKNAKKKEEYETEAGTIQVSVTRVSKITVSGDWTVTGEWLAKFRAWERASTVMVSCFYPSETELSDHECQLSIEKEEHIRYSRDLLKVNGLYKISVKMEEL